MEGGLRTIEVLQYRVDELERILRDQQAEIVAIEERNAKRDAERSAIERKQLLWGISFLGGIIITLGTVIWNYRNVIFRGGT